MADAYQGLLDRVAALEAKQLDLGDIPLRALKHYLEQNWQPDSTSFLLPGSIGPSLLANIPCLRIGITGQVINAGATTQIVWDTTIFDRQNMWYRTSEGGSDGDVFTCQQPGIYYVWAGLVWASVAQPAHNTSITLNRWNGATADYISQTVQFHPANVAMSDDCSGVYYFDKGHTFFVQATNGSVNNQAVSGQAAAAWLGPYR